MAKKSKSKTIASPAAKWSQVEERSLLVWLDHTLKHDKLDFEKTVVKQLNNAFTLNQIDGKLRRLWDLHGSRKPVDTSRKQWRKEQSIYDRGSSCLELLSEIEKKDIASACQILDDEFLASQLAASSHGQRLLRSTSKAERGSISQNATISGDKPETYHTTIASVLPGFHELPTVEHCTPRLSNRPPRPKRQKLMPHTVGIPLDVNHIGLRNLQQRTPTHSM